MDILTELTTEIDRLTSGLPAPIQQVVEALAGDGLQAILGTVKTGWAGRVAAAKPAAVARLVADGWDPVGTRNQAHEAPASPAEAIHDAIRSALYVLLEEVVLQAGVHEGADQVAEELRLREEDGILIALTPSVAVGMTAQALVDAIAPLASKLPL